MYRSRSSIISAINNLENEIGYKLINREPKGISFTKDGKRVLNDSKRIIEIIDSWKHKDSNHNIKNIIISSVPSINETYLPELSIKLYQEFPTFNFSYESIYNDINEIFNTAKNNTDNFHIVLGTCNNIELVQFNTLLKHFRCAALPIFKSDFSLYYNRNCKCIDTESSLEEILNSPVKLAIHKNFDKSPLFNLIKYHRQIITLTSLNQVFNLITANENVVALYPSFINDYDIVNKNYISCIKCSDYNYSFNYYIIYDINFDSDFVLSTIISYIKNYFLNK